MGKRIPKGITKPEVPSSDNVFELDGKKYKVLLPVMNIPGVGKRTALEVISDPEAQKYLVEANCIGSVLEEVTI